jgi:hypothetical protein
VESYAGTCEIYYVASLPPGLPPALPRNVFVCASVYSPSKKKLSPLPTSLLNKYARPLPPELGGGMTAGGGGDGRGADKKAGPAAVGRQSQAGAGSGGPPPTGVYDKRDGVARQGAESGGTPHATGTQGRWE